MRFENGDEARKVVGPFVERGGSRRELFVYFSTATGIGLRCLGRGCDGGYEGLTDWEVVSSAWPHARRFCQ